MDLTQTIQPNSLQLNADDLVSGPVIVQIQEVIAGDAEQPVFVKLVQFPGRTYRPSKSMRRVMVEAWGKEASIYAGRSLELFRNPDIRFGKDVVGGIQISRMSHLEKPLKIALTVSRGKRSQFSVTPLPAALPPRNFLAELATLKTPEDIAELGTEAAASGAGDDVLGPIRDAYKRAVKLIDQDNA